MHNVKYKHALNQCSSTGGQEGHLEGHDTLLILIKILITHKHFFENVIKVQLIGNW